MRIRPAIDGQKEGDQTLKKVSADMVAVEDRKFTFDSVFDSKAKQVPFRSSLIYYFLCFKQNINIFMLLCCV